MTPTLAYPPDNQTNLGQDDWGFPLAPTGATLAGYRADCPEWTLENYKAGNAMYPHWQWESPSAFLGNLRDGYSWALQFELALMAELRRLRRIVKPQFGASDTNFLYGIDATNPIDKFTYWATTGGSTVTIYHNTNGYGSPRNMTAWGYYGAITSGMEIHAAGGRSTIKYIISSDANTTVLAMESPLPSYTGAVNVWGALVQYERWPVIVPRRPVWTSRVTSPWISVDDLPGNYLYELKTASGASTRIAMSPQAWTYNGEGTVTRQGNLRVYTSTADSPSLNGAVDNTAYWLVGFPGTNARVYNTYYAGDWYSFIKLDKHVSTPSVKWYRVEYCPEVSLSMSDKYLLVRSLSSCAWNRPDWTGSIGNCNVSGTAIDANGFHWECRKRKTEGVDLSQYHAECENAQCPHFLSCTVTGTWMPSIDEIKRLWFAYDEYLTQMFVGVPTQACGRVLFPSLCCLAGMPRYYTTGLPVQNMDAQTGYYGYLDNSTPFRKLITGAFKGDGTGVFERHNFAQQGDVLGNSFDDGSDDYVTLNNSLPGVREIGWTPPYPGSYIAGYSEKYVQRKRNRRLALRPVDLSAEKIGVTQNYLQNSTIVHNQDVDTDELVIQLARSVPPIPIVSIPDEAKYVHSATLNGYVLECQFQPGIRAAAYLVGGDMYSGLYASSGATVEYTEARKGDSQKRRNYGQSDDQSAFGKVLRAQKGVTGRFTTAPGALANVKLTAIWAKAGAGDTFTGTVNGAGTDKIIFVPGGACMPDATPPEDEKNVITLEGIKYYYTTPNPSFDETSATSQNFGDFNWDLEDDVAAAVQLFFNGTGYIITPGQMYVTNALMQYSGGNPEVLDYQVSYRITGDSADPPFRTKTQKILQVTTGASGGSFYAIPNVKLRGEPSLLISTAPSVEWLNPATNRWVLANLTSDLVIHSSAGSELVLPEHGTVRFVSKNGSYFMMLPIEYWGYQLRLNVTYGAGAAVDSATTPASFSGNGHPADYEDYRLKKDIVRFLIEPNDPGQMELAYWLIDEFAGGYTANALKAEFDMSAVMPPTQYYNASGVLTEADHKLEVYHVEYTGLGLATSETLLEEGTDYWISRTMGKVIIKDVSGWDRNKQHCVFLDFVGLDMENKGCVEAFTGMEDAAGLLETYNGPSFNFGTFINLVDYTDTPQSPYGNGEVIKLSPDGLDNGEYPAGSVYDLSDYISIYPDASTRSPKYFPALPPEIGLNGALMIYSVGILASFAIAIRRMFHAVSIPMIHAINPDEILGAHVDLSITNGVYKEYYTKKYQVDGHDAYEWPGPGVELPYTDLYIGAYKATWGVDGSVSLDQFIGAVPTGGMQTETINGDEFHRGTVDITTIIQAISANPATGNQSYLFAIQGTDSGGTDAYSMLQSWVSQAYLKMRPEGQTYGPLEYEYRYRAIEGNSIISFSNLRITVNHAAVRSHAGPVVPYPNLPFD
jgi:hypothetical protein